MSDSRWKVVWGSLVALTVGPTSVVFYTQSLFLGPMTHEFGWSPATFFLAILGGGVAGALATPVAGRLLDHFGVRRVLIPGIVLFAACNAVMALLAGAVSGYIAVSAAVAVAGVVQGPLSYAKAITGWFDRRRGLALAVALCGTGIGGVFIPPLTAWLIDGYGWRAARVGLSLVVLCVALPPVILLVREARPSPIGDTGDTLGPAIEGVSTRDALRDPVLWMLVAAFLASSAVVNGVLANLVPLIVAGGSSRGVATAALSILALGQIGGRLLSGILLDRVQSAKVGVVWYGCAIVGLAVISGSHPAPAILAGTALIGAAVGAELEMAAVFTSRFFGRRHFGAINGIIFAAYLLGAAGGPLLASLMAVPDGGYGHLGVAGITLLGVAALLLLVTGQYRYMPPGRAINE